MEQQSSLPKPLAVGSVLFVLLLGASLLSRVGDPASEAKSTPSAEKPTRNTDVAASADYPIPPAEAAILQALSKRITVNFEDTPLLDVVSHLKNELGLEILIDEVALDEEGLDTDTLIVRDFVDMRATSLLEFLLEPLGLTYVIRNDVLWITSQVVADEIVDTRIYDVGGLIRSERGFEWLTEAIKEVTSGLWEEYDGTGGTMTGFESEGVRMLVIRQSWQMQQEIRKFLTDIRRTKELSATWKPLKSLSSDETTSQQIYYDERSSQRGSSGNSPEFALGTQPVNEAVVAGNSQFAFDLYENLRQGTKENLFFSPYSISTALAMLYGGADGRTEEEIANVLHFPENQEQFHSGFAMLQRLVHGGPHRSSVELEVANRLWGQTGYPILDPFLQTTRDHYGAELALVDFAESEAARQEINLWVEEQTDYKIRELIPSGYLDYLTRFVLTNAIYFHGNWAEPFLKKDTKPEDFDTGSGKLKVPMMYLKESSRYGEFDGLQVLEKPYAGGTVSMVVLLPEKSENALEQLESSLSPQHVDVWLANMTTEMVEIYLPRFRFTKPYKLKGVLSDMGMPSTFDVSVAKFSSISDEPGIFVGEVFHKAYIEVNEKGTTAAAATGFGGGGGGGFEPPPEPIFRADHPFVFLIRDNVTGSILFLGRVMNPKARR